jgi:hypothetical protein
MEGLSPWVLLTVSAGYGLAGVSLLPVVAAVGFLLAGRPHQALQAFAAAVLAWAVAAALFASVVPGPGGLRQFVEFAFAAGLFLAGTGQFVAALRNPRCYPAALICSVTSSAFVGSRMPGTWLRIILVAGPFLLLGAASLKIALRHDEKPRSRSLKQILSLLVLINLTVFLLALAFAQTDSRIVYVDNVNVIVVGDQIADLVTNTKWKPVFASLAVSALVSAVAFVSRSWWRSPGIE